MKYSILVPVYNKEQFLRKYFKYIENQTLKDYEVVVVDDCSNDKSYEYLCERSKLYNNIKLFHNETNMGIGMVRNILIKNSIGKYLIFVDPDDRIDIHLLSEIDKENDNLDIIRFQNVIEPMTDKQKEFELRKDKYRYCCEPTNVISGEEALLKWHIGKRKINTFPWTYAIKRELYNDVLYPNIRNLEDFAITPYLISKAKRVKAIDFVGYHYKKYDDSLSSDKKNLDYAINKLNLFKQIVELTEYYINKSPISDESKTFFLNDVHNRYIIRKEKIDDIFVNKKINQTNKTK